MARQQRHQEPAEVPAEPLPSTHWTVLGAVRWPGDPEQRIDEVVVGPSGVHVILHHRDHPGVTAEALEAEVGQDVGWGQTTARASAAAAAVVGLLPDRYRHAARAAVCLCDTSDLGCVVDDVRLASPAPLRFAVRHQDRVLSTSEVAGISRRLRLALTPYPPEPLPGRARSRQRIRRRLALAGLTTAAASALLVEVGHGRLW
jgi:hypothetical protein